MARGPIKKPSRILKMARRRVAERKHDYTCWALDALVGEGKVASNDVEPIKKYIKQLLCTRPTLEAWLRSMQLLRQVTVSCLTDNELAKVKETRLAWIDWMIKQYEEQGR